MTHSVILLCFCSTILFTSAEPVTEPTYSNQYVPGQQAVQYRPQYYLQPQYETAQPAQSAGLQKYSTQIKQPIQQVASSDERQAQRVSQVSLPYYLQALQQAQLGAQAQEAFAGAQKKQPVQQLRSQQQPQAYLVQAQPQYLKQVPQQAQYLKQVPQQVQYVTRPVAQGYRPQQQQQPEEEPEEPKEKTDDYDPSPSYQFGFDVNDDHNTNYQNRKEQREGNKITGSYSVVDSDGYVRTVTYTADPKEGFKAEVTRQPTDIVVKIPKPDPQYVKQPLYYRPQYIQAVPVQQGRVQQGKVQQGKDQQQQNVVYQYQ